MYNLIKRSIQTAGGIFYERRQKMPADEKSDGDNSGMYISYFLWQQNADNGEGKCHTEK